VRRTAFWALGRTSDLRIAPLLIEGLNDANLDCMVEARNALNYLSKKVIPIELPDQPTDAQRKTAVAAWRKWYLSVRPYDERDDLTDTSRP
jgi:tRNA splicing ligase